MKISQKAIMSGITCYDCKTCNLWCNARHGAKIMLITKQYKGIKEKHFTFWCNTLQKCIFKPRMKLEHFSLFPPKIFFLVQWHCNLWLICMLTNYEIVMAFFNTESWLADKNQLFPYLKLILKNLQQLFRVNNKTLLSYFVE